MPSVRSHVVDQDRMRVIFLVGISVLSFRQYFKAVSWDMGDGKGIHHLKYAAPVTSRKFSFGRPNPTWNSFGKEGWLNQH